MAIGSGTFSGNTFDKVIPGVYNQVIYFYEGTQPTTAGTVGAVLPMDWGSQDEPAVITRSDFTGNAEALTGYSYDAPENTALREIFRHADAVVLSRLGKGGNKAYNGDVGTAKYFGGAGNKIAVTCYENINHKDYFDVETFFNNHSVDLQTVEGALEKVAVLSKVEEKPGETVESCDVEFTLEDNVITAKYSNIPDGYKISCTLKLGSVITAYVPGRVDKEETTDTIKITYGPKAAYKAPYTLECKITTDGTSKNTKTIKSCVYNMTVEEGEEIAGADGSKLADNEFVTFNDGIIPVSAGYVFTGGESKETVTGADYQTALDNLEGYPFNILVAGTTDDTVKALVAEYTRRNREDNGNYFQSVLYRVNTPDSEGIVNVYNDTIGSAKESDLVYFHAGLLASCPLDEERTFSVYDGELTVNDNLTQSRIVDLDSQGYALYHRTGRNETSTYLDVNSLLTYTDEKSREARNNQPIRVADSILNRLNEALRRQTIGKIKNNPAGRSTIWKVVNDILQREYADEGYIDDYDGTEDVTVSPIAGQPHAILVEVRIRVSGMTRFIYLRNTVIVEEELNG